MKRNAPRVNNPARLARLRDQAIKLRERVKRSTLALVERSQARFTWWQRAFRVPMVADWATFTKAKTLLSAFMGLLGLASGKKTSLIALQADQSSSSVPRRSLRFEKRNLNRNRRPLYAEGLEERRVLAAVLGVGTGALVGNDLTDLGNNGLEGSYNAPSNLAGFDGVFFANLKPNFGSFQAAFNVFDNRAGGAGDDKALWGFPDTPNQLQPMIVGANFATTHGARVLTSFTITSGEDTPGRDPIRWKIEGSNDTTTGLNGTWTTIYDKAVGGSDWAQRLQVNRYSPADGDVFLTSQPFTAFRMVTTATGIWTMGSVQANTDLFQLSEIEFFGVPGNNSPAVNLSVSSATGTEVGTTAITVNATAASAVSGDQTVSLAVTGTGIAASDYALSNSTITILNGATSGSVTFSVKDDLLSEGTETATLTISSPSAGITLGTTLTQNVTITDNDNAGTSNYGLPATGAYRVVRNGSTIEIYNSTPVLVASRPLGTDALVINGTSGNDSLTIDLSGGNFTVPITFNGGSQTSTPGDILNLTGGSFATGTFAFTNANDGTINLTGNSQISYTGLEPIVTTGTTIDDLILTFNGGAETITLTDASGAAMTIDSPLSESLTFANPSSSLTINAGTGDDIVNITSVDTAFNAVLTINGDANNDTVTLTPALSLASLTITAETINVNGGTVTTTGSQSYNGPVNLGSNTTLGTADVTFASTVNSPSPASLIVTASGSGLVTFSGNVGGTAPLSSLTVNAINVTAAAIATTSGVSVNNTGIASNISGAITGAGATLTKAGAGTLTLSGSNLYTGATNINAGTLRIAGAPAAPAGAAGIFTFDSVSGSTVNNTGSAGVGKNGSLLAGSALVGGGRSGNAMSTSGGTGARMDIASAGISLAGGNWTGAAWFNNLFNDTDWNTLFVDSNAGDAPLIIEAGSNRLGSWVGNSFRPSPYDLVPAANSGWHHVAAVGSGSTTSFYRNGVLVGTANGKSVTNITSVGASPAGGGMQRFAQLIDDVYIYQSALTASEIMALYNSGAVTASNSIPDGSTVTIAGGAFLDLNGSSEAIGSLAGAGTVTSGIAGSPTLTVGGDNGSSSFSGAIQNGAGTVSLAKTGTGTQTLSGSNLYTGATAVNNGTLVINGSVTSNVTVTTPGVLNGSGTVTGNVSGNGTFSPGNSLGNVPGIMTIVGNFTPSGTVNFEVNSAWTTAGTHFDQYSVTGLVNMAGSTVTFTNTDDASAPAANSVSVIKLIDNNGTLDLTTAATTPVNGASVTIGSRTFKLFYNGGDGNDVIITRNSAPTAANSSVTSNEDVTYTFVATDFNFSDADSSDVLSAVKITSIESVGDLEWFNGSSWVDVTQDQEISKADIDASRLRFVPDANASGSPYSIFGFMVKDTGGPALSVSAYTLTITVSAINDVPVAQGSSVTTNEDIAKPFAVGDFLFTDLEGDSLASITISSLNLASGDTLKLSGTDVAVGQTITAANIPNLVYTPAADANGAARSSFGFTANDASNGTVAATMTINVTAVDDAPVLTINDTSTYVENAVPTVVAPNLTLTDTDGPNVSGATVSLTTNFNSAQDSLLFTNQNGISGSYNSATGILSLSGSASAAAYQTVLRSVTYSNNSQNPTAGARSVQFSVGSSTLANPANGHFYEFVSAAGGSWTSANAAASSRTLFGLQGYLATVTSASENAFIAGKLIGQGWMGASDAEVEGTWRWVTGPEAGQQFWQGAGGGSAVNGMYNNWTPGEPNNFGPFGEDYAHFRIDNSWNDYRVDNGSTHGYVVEYGGMPGDPTLLQLIGTATVSVVAVNDAPSGANKTLTTNEDTQLTIVAADLGFSDAAEGHAFNRVQVTTLPATGTLRLNGVAISAGDFATKAQLDANQLTFDAVANASGSPYTAFTFQVEDDGGTDNGGVNLDITPKTFTINVSAINDVPVAQGSSVTTNEDTAKTFAVSDFLFTDVEGDSLTSITISSLNLASGDTLKLSGADVTVGQTITAANIPNLVYAPFANANGAARSTFGFTANDASSGTVAAIMTINVTSVTDVSIGDASVTEGGNLQFNVSLESTVDVDTVITYSTADGSATTADSDYASQTLQTLTIPAGQTSGTITIVTTADNKVEQDETMTVQLTGVNGVQFSGAASTLTGTGTIINNDVERSLRFVDPNPNPGNQFGATVVALSGGNIVITSPFDDAGGLNAGAVYLFNGATGQLISTLTGSIANDNVGIGGVTALSNGNYVVMSPSWDNGAVVNAGAVTLGSGTTGVSGAVSVANSLVGTTSGDMSTGNVKALSNGNYVVINQLWDNGTVLNAGAVTFGSGTMGVSGAISATNSLVGSSTADIRSDGVIELTNGNYVVNSPEWDSGTVLNAGAVTFGSGTTGVSGAISVTNSLVGSTTNDAVGNFGVTALSNGNYVVNSVGWDNGAATNAGAVTFGNGTTGVTGAVSASNSLVGTTIEDQVGRNGVTALSNGNYVVTSQNWDNGTLGNAGAATFASGLTGISGAVSAANSLVGSKFGDQVGAGGATALSNGNYVVTSLNWRNNFGGVQAGAVTFGNGTTGIIGVVSSDNSLIGSKTSDRVGVGGVRALTNGNYVVISPEWDNGATFNAGAVTFGDGTTGITGVVSTTNSLVGSTTNDRVGSDLLGFRGVTALSNGNYVVSSRIWDNGAVVDAGAVTFGSGTTGVSGAVSATNSLVGSTSGDMSSGNVTALSNGNYVVVNSLWDNGAVANAGAVTFGSGTTGVSGAISATNSLVGTRATDNVGIGGVTALSNGNYVVGSQNWDNGAVLNVGAVTFGSGTAGVSGAVSVTNSLVGTRANDNVGIGGVTALSNGNYVVRSQNWDNGTRVNAGAVTFGNGSTGVSGTISATNSAIGATSNTALQTVVADDVYGYFIGRFVNEANGKVRLGFQADGFADQLSLSVDGPNDGFAGVAGQLRPFTLSATSPSASVYQYSINWGDGSAIETISNAQSVTNVQHRFLLPGTFNPIVTVYDGFETFETTIANVVILSNELQSGVLAIGATDGGSNNDSIIVTRLDSSSNVSIQINGRPLVGAPASLSVPAGGIRVYSGDGTDGLVVRGTAAADVVRISAARILLDDAVDIIVEHDASIETRRVESMDGDDTVHLDGGLSVVVDGGIGNDTIQSLANAATTWNVSGANSGTVSSGNQTTSFSNTETLRGSDSASDAFTVAATGSLSGSISGGSGSSIDRLSTLSRTAALNIALQSVSGLGQGFSEIESFVGNGSALTGPNSTNTWTVAVPGAGTLSSGESTYFFSGYATLNGGTDNDIFRIPNGLVIALNGGLGSDTLEMTSTTVINRWDVTGAGIGSVGSSTLRSSFSAIERLVGSNEVVDQFNMRTSSSIDFLDAGSGPGDTLSYSNTATTVNIGASSATGVSLFVGLERFATTAGTLIGAATSSTWNISGPNSGTVVTGAGSETRSYEFAGFSILTGGAGNDRFQLPSTASIGTINGGSGIDTIDYSSRAASIRTIITAYDASSGANGNGTNISSFSGVESFLGSSVAGDLLQGPAGGMEWWASGDQSGRFGALGSLTALGTYSGFDSIQGGSGVDSFTIEANGYLASINGGTGSESDLLVGPNNDVVWQLTGVRSGTMTATGASGIRFSNMSNLTGGSGADTFAFYNAGSVPGRLNPGGGENTLSYEFRSTNVSVILVAAPPLATSVGTLIDDETNNFAIVIGGNGNDVLVGSASRGMVLVGGPGNDVISGGTGRDILIGGLGADTLSGGLGQDIVVGGRVTHDANVDSLRKIRSEWIETRSYTERIANLRGDTTTGLNGSNYLSNISPSGDTLLDDASVDTLYGGNDLDWLIGSQSDMMPDWETIAGITERKDSPVN